MKTLGKGLLVYFWVSILRHYIPYVNWLFCAFGVYLIIKIVKGMIDDWDEMPWYGWGLIATAPIGIFLNVLVVTVNGGKMPVFTDSEITGFGWTKADSSTIFPLLADRFAGFSLGDMFIGAFFVIVLLSWIIGEKPYRVILQRIKVAPHSGLVGSDRIRDSGERKQKEQTTE